jgi:hypothetical protein
VSGKRRRRRGEPSGEGDTVPMPPAFIPLPTVTATLDDLAGLIAVPATPFAPSRTTPPTDSLTEPLTEPLTARRAALEPPTVRRALREPSAVVLARVETLDAVSALLRLPATPFRPGSFRPAAQAPAHADSGTAESISSLARLPATPFEPPPPPPPPSAPSPLKSRARRALGLPRLASIDQAVPPRLVRPTPAPSPRAVAAPPRPAPIAREVVHYAELCAADDLDPAERAAVTARFRVRDPQVRAQLDRLWSARFARDEALRAEFELYLRTFRLGAAREVPFAPSLPPPVPANPLAHL